MSVLNVALADIRNTPYVQIINSSMLFFSEFSSKGGELMWRHIQKQGIGALFSMSAFMGTSRF